QLRCVHYLSRAALAAGGVHASTASTRIWSRCRSKSAGGSAMTAKKGRLAPGSSLRATRADWSVRLRRSASAGERTDHTSSGLRFRFGRPIRHQFGGHAYRAPHLAGAVLDPAADVEHRLAGSRIVEPADDAGGDHLRRGPEP